MNENIRFTYNITVSDIKVASVTYGFDVKLYNSDFIFTPLDKVAIKDNEAEIQKQLNEIKLTCKNRAEQLGYPFVIF
ncbi:MULTISPECIES: hypothetical protein [unclassified Clostridium]|uniref:hypothetical protein n=1 Tax=unclassified Clostridium TaxID=2614128 RepID=UPI0025B7B9A1|nr:MULTISPECIES: hypothetical protein [unclassified Clostridium]